MFGSLIFPFFKKISHIVKLGIYIDLQFLLSDVSSKIVNFVTWSKVWVDLSTSLLIWGNSLFLSSVRLLSWCIVKYSSSYRISVISLMRSFTHQKKKKKKGVQNSKSLYMGKFRKISLHVWCHCVESSRSVLSPKNNN